MFLLLMIALPMLPSQTPPIYTSSEIAQAREASQSPWDYEDMGLPTDMLSSTRMDCMLVELRGLRGELYLKPRKVQARYADAICRAKTADEEWVDLMLQQSDEVTVDSYDRINECGLGNLAYFALYAPREDQREKAEIILQRYIDWRTPEDPTCCGWKNWAWYWITFPFRCEFPDTEDYTDPFTTFDCWLHKNEWIRFL